MSLTPLKQISSYEKIKYDNILSYLEDCKTHNVINGKFENIKITSNFQPIISLSHKRVVGYEALIRGYLEDGEYISPPKIFEQVKTHENKIFLDRLSQAVHFHNFIIQNDTNSWLFINMTTEVFVDIKNNADSFFQKLLEDTGLPPNRIVIEILEQSVLDDSEFNAAVDFFKERGFLVAIDDFGAGHSNFDRVWKVKPEIVKLDKSIIKQAVQSYDVRQTLPQIISLLHEYGSLVLMEGIETAEEAHIALDADADFVQGYFFARPHKSIEVKEETSFLIEYVWENFDSRRKDELRSYRNFISPYLNAIGYAAALLSAGKSFEESCASFLELDSSKLCYILDENGEQIGNSLWGRRFIGEVDNRFKPLLDTNQSKWSRRSYFRRAIDEFNKVQVTRPYLSITAADLCVTFSCSYKYGGKTFVVCGDISYSEHLNNVRDLEE